MKREGCGTGDTFLSDGQAPSPATDTSGGLNVKHEKKRLRSEE